MTTAPPLPPEHLALAAPFPSADRAQWQELVAVALRKSGLISDDTPVTEVETVLTSTTYDGLRLLPLYTAADAPAGPAGQAPDREPGTTGWDVRQRHADPDPALTREAVLADLENGVSSLWLVIGPAGLPLGSLAEVLGDVYLDLAPVLLDAGRDTEAAAAEFLAVLAERKLVAGVAAGNLGADPIGLRAGTGADADLAILGRLAQRCLTEAPGLRAATVDATVYHDAGGSDAEELGASLATGVAYLRELTGAGLSLEQALDQLDFRYAASADQFLTIAKFRAARRLWARVAEVCGAPAVAGQRQHAVTSSAMLSQRDPWVNLLRSTLACFGAGVGGADAVTVQPFDAALGLPDGFARRIARNTSSLLLLEAQVAQVADPAGGSWYVERLTDDLAVAAWGWFTEIEQAGGMLAALDAGLIGDRLEQTWQRRAENLAYRRDPLTGVSEYPNLDEKPLARKPFPGVVEPGPGPGLVRRRYAQEYEALRDAADQHAERTGSRAAVFLATIGSVAASTARAGFAGNLFQVGGLATPIGDGGLDPDAIGRQFAESGAEVACLAASDRLYAEHASAVAAALIKAGAQAVWLAGSPGQRAAADAEAGIGGHVFTGVNALEVLRAVHQQTGISR